MVPPLSSEEMCKTNKCIMSTSQKQIDRNGMASHKHRVQGYLRANLFAKAFQEVEAT